MREDGTLYLALPGDVEASTRRLAGPRPPVCRGGSSAALLAWLPRPPPPRRSRTTWSSTRPSPTWPRTRRWRSGAGRCAGEAAGAPGRLHRGGGADCFERAYHAGQIVDARRARRWGAPSAWPASWAIGRAVLSAASRALRPPLPALPRDRAAASAEWAQPDQPDHRRVHPPGPAVRLPPASALKAHLRPRTRRPLGLAVEEGPASASSSSSPTSSRPALAAAPERGEEITPDSVIAFGAWAGRLGKGEWGLAREQLELLAAALLRTGHLIPLDAFLQPLRFEAVAAPLGEFLPYVMRAPPPARAGGPARCAGALLVGGDGTHGDGLDAPGPGAGLRDCSPGPGRCASPRVRTLRSRRAAAATDFATTRRPGRRCWPVPRAGGGPDRDAGRGASLAGGLARTGGGGRACRAVRSPRRRAVARWGERRGLPARPSARPDRRLPPVHRPRDHPAPSRPCSPPRTRRHARAFAAPEEMVADRARCGRPPPPFLEAYRRHYLAWHERSTPRHASTPCSKRLPQRRDGGGAASRPGPACEVTPRRGWRASSAAAWGGAATRDPLPVGHVVCPLCGLPLGQEVELPTAEEIAAKAAVPREEQRAELAPARPPPATRGGQPRIAEGAGNPVGPSRRARRRRKRRP